MATLFLCSGYFSQLAQRWLVQTLFSLGIPVLKNRELDTNITVPDKTTIVIGGLISEEVNMVESRVPILSRIPLIGRIFRDRQKQVNRIGDGNGEYYRRRIGGDHAKGRMGSGGVPAAGRSDVAVPNRASISPAAPDGEATYGRQIGLEVRPV